MGTDFKSVPINSLKEGPGSAWMKSFLLTNLLTIIVNKKLSWFLKREDFIQYVSEGKT